MSTKYSIGIVIPYFGRFNSFFYIWLKSVSFNPTIDFLIFTDDLSIEEECKKYSNVHFYNFSFAELNHLIRQKIGAKACARTAYKLCDFKPSYGKLFEDYLNVYDFWGYCDVDMIFGDIRKYITDDILDKYSHIYSLGHFSINRNNEEMKNLFMTTIPNNICFPFIYYPNVENCAFDETTFNDICKARHIASFNDFDAYCDLYTREYGFLNVRNKIVKNYFVAVFINGKLFALEKDNITTEQFYLHLQKRKMLVDNDCFLESNLLICPNECLALNKNVNPLNYLVDEKKNDYKRFINKKYKLTIFYRIKRKLQYIIYGKLLNKRRKQKYV